MFFVIKTLNIYCKLNMYGSKVLGLLVSSFTLLTLDNKISGCSPPEHHAPRSFRSRVNSADIVVFATVLESPAQSGQNIGKYYSAKLSVHCILKGPELPKILHVSGFGNDGGGCTTTVAIKYKPYIFMLRKLFDKFVVHEVDVARASKQASEKLLLKILPDFWDKAHRPYSNATKRSKYRHCPSFKRMKRILRKSMRQYIRSQPKLSRKKQQLRKWLRKQRKLRKAARKTSKETGSVTIFTFANYVERSKQLKKNKKLQRRDSFGVGRERRSIFKRSNSQFEADKAYYENALSFARTLSTNPTLLCFMWLIAILIGR